MAQNKTLFKKEEICFRWNDETGEYRTMEIGIDAGIGVYIFCRRGIKGDDESKTDISFKLQEKELLKLKLCIEKILEERKKELFR